MILRDYQQHIVDSVRAKIMNGKRRPLVVAPCGSGKTVIFAHIARLAQAKNKRTVIVVHRRELIRQAYDKLKAIGVTPGLILANEQTDYDNMVQVASIQSLARRLHLISQPHLIIMDEAHHATAGNWKRVSEAYPKANIIGFTATPYRMDGRGLGDIFDSMVLGPSVTYLQGHGHLCNARYYAPPQVDMSGVQVIAGDYVRSQAVERVRAITGDVIEHYHRLADNTQAIAYCAGVDHSKSVAEAFGLDGVSAAHMDGTMLQKQRDDIMSKFRNGEIKILCNSDLFGEGLDVPNVHTAILLRPTKSLSLHIQQIGRPLRPAPGKSHAIIIDHVGNCIEHGMAEDDRVWGLEGRQKKQRDAMPAASRCDSCFAMWPGTSRICPQCGCERKQTAREIKQVEGELEELKAKQARTERKSARTLEELVEIGITRGYKNPQYWAKRVFQGRQKR